MQALKLADESVFEIVMQEAVRQQGTINLIASENYVSKAVLEATGSVLTNKYAEGYPGKRYYPGCQLADEVELLAIERCKKLFGSEHANVQPHAGSPANMAVYMAVLNPGDTLLGMSLSEGGHLTHGHTVNFSGRWYTSVQYKLNRETERLDYDEIQQLAVRHKPKLIIAGASAYSRTIDFERFASIAQSVDALLMVDIAHIAGLVATGQHPSPIGFADFITSTTHKTLRGPRGGLIMCKKQHAEHLDKTVMPGMQGGPFMHTIAAKAVAFGQALQPEFTNYTQQIIKNAQIMAQTFIDLGYRIVAGGTDNHLFIIDLQSHRITGLQAEQTLAKVDINVTRSCIPFDTQKPWVTSGIRVGTPAITTRGMQEAQAVQIAHFVDECLRNVNDGAHLKALKEQVALLCSKFPLEY
jgi:glycine hydroxymethyltransferase